MTSRAAKGLLGRTGGTLLSRLQAEHRAAESRGDDKASASLRIAIDELAAARDMAAKATVPA